MIAYDAIVAAQSRIAPYVQHTLLEDAPGLGPQISLKLENTQRTHSFKVRGALNAILSLGPTAGIVTASSGNHAQGVAYAAAIAGIPAKILMPPHTPRRKIAGVERYGAEAILFGSGYDDAENEALRLAHELGYTFVSAYNDPQVIAGAGTIGLEITAQCPEVARVLVCVSGGGLISGIATAIKHLRPATEVIGVGAESSPALYNAFYGLNLPHQAETLAEALSGDIESGSITIPITRALVDRIVLVSESAIASAMRWMIAEQGWLVEGGGAVGVGAVLSGQIALDDRPTVIVISGGNADLATFQRVVSV
ncbi:MAG: threonine/serine dehydratase [Anaerolineae bacterium]|jgi:threonine dehydratase|nr:threonine/serine dehydratase [Anaerolineae bacterium]